MEKTEKGKKMKKKTISTTGILWTTIFILLLVAVIATINKEKEVTENAITVTIPTEKGSVPVRMIVQSIPKDSGLTPKTISKILNGPFEAAIHGFGPHDEEYRDGADDTKSISALLSEERIKSPERAEAPQ